MSRISFICALSILLSFTAEAEERPSYFKTVSIEPVKVKEVSFQLINENTLRIEPVQKPYDPFHFVNMNIPRTKFRVCCIGAGYGIKYRF